jgi:uncharacterized membrane protein HdeD (DUF308 family)
MQKATVGGILSIVSSALGILYGLFIMATPLWLNYLIDSTTGRMTQEDTQVLTIMSTMYVVMGAFVLLIGVLGIVGGIYAIKRRMWGLALTGAIAGSMIFYPLGIVAVILVSMAQQEFAKSPSTVPAN